MEPTPLDIVMFNAQMFAANIFFGAEINKLIVKGEECRKGVLDVTLPSAVRIQALEESRQINAILIGVAEAKAEIGISA